MDVLNCGADAVNLFMKFSILILKNDVVIISIYELSLLSCLISNLHNNKPEKVDYVRIASNVIVKTGGV